MNPEPRTQAKPSRASARKEFIVGGGAVVLFFVVFGLWAAFARLDAAVHGGGFVIVSGHRQAVQHREGGIVSGIYVREGDQVSAGEVQVSASLKMQYISFLERSRNGLKN